MQDLEFRFDQLVRILGVAPRLPITVYLFPSAAAKKDLVGAGGTLYAKPWTQEIFIQAERFPARRLRHELAHVFASAFGDPIFGVSLAWRLPLPRLASGLIEGIAEAADYGDPWGRSTVHQEARAMIAARLAPPLAQVVGAGFSTDLGAAGLHHRRLLHPLPARDPGARAAAGHLPLGRRLRGVYGRPLAALEPEWRALPREAAARPAGAGPGPRAVPAPGHLRQGVRAGAGGPGAGGARAAVLRAREGGRPPALGLPGRPAGAELPAGPGRCLRRRRPDRTRPCARRRWSRTTRR